MSSERFWKVLEGFEAFCDIWRVLWGISLRSHGSESFWRSQTSIDAFACSESFWGVFMGLERFWKTPGRSDESSYVVGWSEAFSSVLTGTIRFWGVIRLSGVFCFVLKCFHWFLVVLKDSCTLWVILWSYGDDVVRHSEAFQRFWVVLKCLKVFW